MTDPTLKSATEAAERVVALSNRLLEGSRPYSDTDARGVALRNCRVCALSCTMVLNILGHLEAGSITSDQFEKLVGLTTGTSHAAARALAKMTRLGFITLFVFPIENLFKNLLRGLGKEPPKGYYDIACAALESVSVNDPDSKLGILNTPALIRNSLHANGIHYGYKDSSTSINIGGVVFDFAHGRPVRCAGWGHIVHALDAVLAVAMEIISTPEIKALKDPIQDQYASEQATGSQL